MSRDLTKMSDDELIKIASESKAHVHTRDAADWQANDGIPLLHELARRFKNLVWRYAQTLDPYHGDY